MKKTNQFIPVVVVVALFLFLRLFHFLASLNYGADQGMTILEIYNLYKAKKMTLIAQTGTSLSVFGRYFYGGSFFYYLFMPILILFNFNPLSLSYFLIILQLTGLIAVYFVISKSERKSQTGLYFALIYAFLPIMVDYSRFIWAPNLLIPASSFILAILIFSSAKKRKNNLFIILMGILLGLGLQTHYSFSLVILMTLIWLLKIGKWRLSFFFFLILGFVIGFSPIILFELRHNFYNLNTFLLYLTVKTGKGEAILRFSRHYLLSLMPFLIYFSAKILERLRKVNRYLTYLIIISFIIYSSFKILPVPKSGFAMGPGWNYQGLKKAERIILWENKENYNLVDLLTGDTRAMALRSLLTLAGKPPLGVTEYPSSQYLFLYSNVPIDRLLSGSLWEIDTVRPVKLTKTWHLQNDIYLYLLEKSAPNSLP